MHIRQIHTGLKREKEKLKIDRDHVINERVTVARVKRIFSSEGEQETRNNQLTRQKEQKKKSSLFPPSF